MTLIEMFNYITCSWKNWILEFKEWIREDDHWVALYDFKELKKKKNEPKIN